MSSWIWMALASAVLAGTSDALTKEQLSRSEERIVLWARIAFCLPWLLIFVSASGWGHIQPGFWGWMAIAVPLEVLAYTWHTRAIHLAPISLVIPFLAFTPLLTIVTAHFFLGEGVSFIGFLGILAVTVGAYLLQMELAADGWLEPIKAMFRSPGIRFMLGAAAIYSITGTLSKKLVQLSNPTTFPFIYLTLTALLLTPMGLQGVRAAGGFSRSLKPLWALYLISGLISTTAFVTHCIGIPHAPVPYFIAIKRLSMLVSVLYGGLLYREEAFPQRIAGTCVMLTGAVLIALTA